LLTCSAWAAKWEIVPTLSLVETYTDNVSLAPDAAKQNDWITQVIPAISIVGTGDRLRFHASYRPELTYHARGSAADEVFQRGNAGGNAELAKDLLFVDVGASVDQHNVSLQGPLTDNNIYTTGNRTTTSTVFVSPYLVHNFGSAARAEARFTHSVVDSNDTAAFSNNVADRASLRVASGPGYRLLTWDLDYTKEIIEYETAGDLDIEVINLNGRRLIFPTVGLLARGGYEYYYYRSGFFPATEGPLWSVGLDWAPSPRTRFAATMGQRFYGDTYSLDFRHRSRLTAWNATYSEEVRTFRSELLIPATTSTAGYLDTLFSSRFPDPAARQRAVDEFIARTGIPLELSDPINVYTTQLFLEKAWRASAGILGARNVVIASVFGLRTEGLVGDLILPNAPNTSIQIGSALLWNWRITTRTAWNLGLIYSRNESPDTGEIGRLSNITMGLSRQIRTRLSGSLGYRFQRNDSNFDGNDYTENAFVATLRLGF
jgi:uncharacterized protein (PEP-CTERM system associated)